MTDTINFILDGDSGGTLVEVRGNLIGKRYLRISDLKEILRTYNGHYKVNKKKGQEADYREKKKKPVAVCSLEACST